MLPPDPNLPEARGRQAALHPTRGRRNACRPGRGVSGRLTPAAGPRGSPGREDLRRRAPPPSPPQPQLSASTASRRPCRAYTDCPTGAVTRMRPRAGAFARSPARIRPAKRTRERRDGSSRHGARVVWPHSASSQGCAAPRRSAPYVGDARDAFIHHAVVEHQHGRILEPRHHFAKYGKDLGPLPPAYRRSPRGPRVERDNALQRVVLVERALVVVPVE